jgi:NSS family neurotransmitter:Na+ symporter
MYFTVCVEFNPRITYALDRIKIIRDLIMQRGQFSSRLAFIFAASGSAVGLGNIWGFPTNAAENGGAAFVLIYLILAFLLAYPAMMAELIIGRHTRANMVSALQSISPSQSSKSIGRLVGIGGMAAAALILSFYSIIAGWMLAFMLEPLTAVLGLGDISRWLTDFSLARNVGFAAIFVTLTVLIISAGVEQGIEKWSSRLMPSLFILMIGLILYVLTQEGAMAGLKHYLVPDFSQITDPKLIVSAMGQAFFSMSLGVGTMLVYGSYIGRMKTCPWWVL